MIDKFTRRDPVFDGQIDNDTAGSDLELNLRRILQLSEGAKPGELAARIAAVLRPEFETLPQLTDEERSPSRLETLVAREQAAYPDPLRKAPRPTEHRIERTPDEPQESEIGAEIHLSFEDEPSYEIVQPPAASLESSRPHPGDFRDTATRVPPPVHPRGPAPAQTAPTQRAAAPQTPSQPAPHQAPTRAQQDISADFVFADEHPLLSLPFTLQVGGRTFEGHSLSLTHLVVSGDGTGPLDSRTRQVARLLIHFDGFDLTLQPEVAVSESHADGSMVLYFTDPTGAHLPQLRYVLNNTISGYVTTLNGLLSYTGPTSPKAPKAPAPPATMSQRVRSIAVLAVSGLLMIAAVVALYSRYTTGFEMHPVFVERTGQQMRASAAGQVAYLNPEAGQGDVIFTVNANTGDVLNFVLPCECEFAISPEISEGTTVLPSDLMLTIFRINSEIRAKTMLSVEGLARAMEGDKVILDLNDGRSIPVEVAISQSTSASALSGDLFVPVQLKTADGVLTAEDVGKNGRLRITSSVLARFGLN